MRQVFLALNALNAVREVAGRAFFLSWFFDGLSTFVLLSAKAGFESNFSLAFLTPLGLLVWSWAIAFAGLAALFVPDRWNRQALPLYALMLANSAPHFWAALMNVRLLVTGA